MSTTAPPSNPVPTADASGSIGAELGPPAGWVGWLGLGALLFFLAAQAVGVLISPPDRDMGHLQKIMYVHVPAAWTAFVAFGVVFLASIIYLWKRSERADLVAASAAEVGTVLTGLTLALGSIWGKPTWGVWWTWDPRLTSTAILFVIFAGYLALRSFVEDPDRRARWCAAVGILGALNVPIVYMSVQWWRTLHQLQSSPATVDAPYALGLRLNAFAFLFIFLYLLARRYRAAKVERVIEVRRERRALEGE
ncbi:MAG TPA: cytochrome c biogenesis protein CcsA [Gemmatimonadaceae bacterium]|nr:cytochrome c biogenesis protein CcsA [Gemmatimonadaceae bacterium]